MPALGQTSDELRLVSWYKAEGEHVTEGDPLFEAETDKTTLEVEAAVSGTLLRLLCEPGATVAAGSTVAWVGAPGEQLEEEAEESASGATPQPPGGREAAGACEPRAGHVLATPAARALAREHGIDVTQLAGSGPGGRIERSDVVAAAAGGAPAPEDELVPRNRQLIAARLTRAAAVPQFAVTRTIDARSALELLAATPAATLTHLLLQALAAALRAHPRVNRVWIDDGPRYRALERCNVGLAIATDDNLIVATIPDPDQVSLDELASTVREAVEQARSGRLAGGFHGPVAVTLSNLGMFGVDRFEAIVDPDQTAILAVGRLNERPAVTSDGIEAVPQLELTLTADHRSVDGAEAARFLAAICAQLEG
jgi:pyruvate dehydrogenase E2 component (dihydrolipoamide acetyltransferase)